MDPPKQTTGVPASQTFAETGIALRSPTTNNFAWTGSLTAPATIISQSYPSNTTHRSGSVVRYISSGSNNVAQASPASTFTSSQLQSQLLTTYSQQTSIQAATAAAAMRELSPRRVVISQATHQTLVSALRSVSPTRIYKSVRNGHRQQSQLVTLLPGAQPAVPTAASLIQTAARATSPSPLWRQRSPSPQPHPFSGASLPLAAAQHSPRTSHSTAQTAHPTTSQSTPISLQTCRALSPVPSVPFASRCPTSCQAVTLISPRFQSPPATATHPGSESLDSGPRLMQTRTLPATSVVMTPRTFPATTPSAAASSGYVVQKDASAKQVSANTAHSQYVPRRMISTSSGFSATSGALQLQAKSTVAVKRASSTSTTMDSIASATRINTVRPPSQSSVRVSADSINIFVHEKRSQQPGLRQLSSAGTLPRKRRVVGGVVFAEEPSTVRGDESTKSGESSSSSKPVSGSLDPRFELFALVVDEPSAIEACCQQFLSKLPGSRSPVRWEDLLGLDPVGVLLEAAAASISSTVSTKKAVQNACDDNDWPRTSCQGWWRALLARFGLFGPGAIIDSPELKELVTASLQLLRDRFAPEVFIRNLRTVHRGTHRLKDRYGHFEFISRGAHGKNYRCKSRLTREEHTCRQFRKDKLRAPSDLIRAEVEILKGVDHPHLPQVIESFEDFNNIYLVLEPLETLELIHVLQKKHSASESLKVGWLAEIVRQLLETLRHCHELRPHSLVHGELSLSSIQLSAASDLDAAPHILLADLGLAGLAPSPPSVANSRTPSELSGQRLASDWLQCASPKLDIWSGGCLLFLLLSGSHPFANGSCINVETAMLPSTALDAAIAASACAYGPPEPDWRLLPSAAAASLCAQMLSWDAKARPTASECLQHSWLSASPPVTSNEETLPLEALGSLLQLCARSKLQQVVTNLVISELSDSPFSSVSAAAAIKTISRPSLSDGGAAAAGVKSQDSSMDSTSIMATEKVVSAMTTLGISARAVDKVIKAFVVEGESSIVNYGQLASAASDLAEDLLDHALWRVFTVAGEDHRGIIDASALEAVASSKGEGASVDVGGEPDRAGGGEGHAGGEHGLKESGALLLSPRQQATGILQEIAAKFAGKEVTFEELKHEVVIRQGLSSRSTEQ